MISLEAVGRAELVDGLQRVGLGRDSAVVVHASLRSFGRVEGGAPAVVDALVEVCGTVIMYAGSWDRTGVPAPPGLVRPDNAFHQASSWAEFDQAVAQASPWDADLPVDRWLGAVAEALRKHPGSRRGDHPIMSFAAIGDRADELLAAARPDWPLGPLHTLAHAGGDVLLLGVDHTSNTTIHAAEQALGMSQFYRYARSSEGWWVELPNISGESHRFDRIEPHLRSFTTETMIGNCRIRRVAAADVLAVTTTLINSDPNALLCDDENCRCGAARRQLRDGTRTPIPPRRS